MQLVKINDTGWFQDNQYHPLGDGYKRKFDKFKKFHWKPEKINGKLYWFKNSYYVRQIIDQHIVYSIGGEEKWAKTEIIQIDEKHFSEGEPHEVYCVYEKLGKLKRV